MDGPLPASAEKLPQTFTSAEGHFRIGLPPTKEKADAGANNAGKTFEWFIINAGHFHVSYSERDRILDTPDVSESVLKSFRDLISSHGQLVADSEMSLSGHPGREFRSKVGNGTQIDRVFLAGNRYYVVSVFVSDRLDCKIESAVKTLDTFEITE